MESHLQPREGSKKYFKEYVFCVTIEGNVSAPISKENILSESKRISIPRFLLEYLGLNEQPILKDHTILTDLAVEKHLVSPGTSPGNYIFLPKGQCIIDTLQSYEKFILSQLVPVFDFNVPVIFEPNTEALRTLTERFSVEKFNRMVSLSGTAKINRYLRYAADPEVFNFLENTVFDSKQLPFILYSAGETARNDDELAGIIRTFSFGQPDYHAITSKANYFDVYMQLHQTTSMVMKKLFSKSSLFIIVDIDKSYLSQHPDIIGEIQKRSLLPILVNVLREKTHYYSIQHQYYMKLETGHFVQIGNLQVDFENG